MRTLLLALLAQLLWAGGVGAQIAVPGPLISTSTHAFVPDERHVWRGPAAAAGVLVWGHGRAASRVDLRGRPPPPYISLFNKAGYDIVRFDRDPDSDDTGRAEGWLRAGLQEMRRLGWRKVIVGGQSRGAWNSLQMLETPGLVDTVIAVSLAQFGDRAGNIQTSGRQYDEIRSIIRGAPEQRTRVVLVQFTGDPFVENAPRRAELYEERLRPKLGALLLIDRPEGLNGHGAGGGTTFSERFGACILRFVLDASPPLSC